MGRAPVHGEAICKAAPLDNVAKVCRARVQAYPITGLPPHFDGDLGHLQRAAKLTLTSTSTAVHKTGHRVCSPRAEARVKGFRLRPTLCPRAP